MDKETLSNYGWIVICVLVLAVMIALATPFGDYISTAVKSTTQGLFDTNKNALNSTGLINIGDQSFSDGTGDSGGGNQTTEVKREAGSIIPNGAKYTIKATNTVLEGNGTNKFPDTPAKGDTYEEGDYKYTYYDSNKWKVIAKDKTKTSYGVILSEIAGKPITNMYNTFENCTSLKTAPVIPNGVTIMTDTFENCTSLTTAPVIPNGVTTMWGTFYNCTSLTTAPAIPGSVTDISNTFQNCTSLTIAPKIPSSITSMTLTFQGCTSLTTAPVIPNSVTSMGDTFQGCTSLKTAPEIPSSVTSMSNTFQLCTSLTTAPKIPSSVTQMYNTFSYCTSLTTAPTIPNGVTDMEETFSGCTSLTGTIEINANPTRYDRCLKDTKITEVTGLTTLKAKILATK